MPNPVSPFAVQSGEGSLLESPSGNSVQIKAHTGNTNGSLTVLEFWVQPTKGPALHTHHREDELWYVLEGDFRFKAGDAMLRASTGGMAFGPRSTPHCFQNIGDSVGRLLVTTRPSGLERFLEESADLPTPPEPSMLAAVGRANWISFVGPPLQICDPL